MASLQAQTMPRWRAIIVDDQSTDGADAEVLRATANDSRFELIRREDHVGGAPHCRNLGIAASKSPLLIFLDSDDLLANHALDQRVAFMNANPDIDFSVSPCLVFESTPGDMDILLNVNKSEDDLDRYLKLDVPWQTTSPTWRRSAIERLGNWNEKLLSWQDWEYHIRALAMRMNYRRLDKPDCYWRSPQSATIGAGSVTAAHYHSHENAILTVANILIEHRQFSPERQMLIARLLLWLAERWLRERNKKEALRVWEIAREKNLLVLSKWSRANLYLKNYYRGTGSYYIRNIMNKMIPSELRFEWSSTFRTIPFKKTHSGELSQ